MRSLIFPLILFFAGTAGAASLPGLSCKQGFAAFAKFAPNLTPHQLDEVLSRVEDWHPSATETQEAETTDWQDVVGHLARSGVPPVPLLDLPPARGGNRSLPFGHFFYGGTRFDYANLTPAQKRPDHGTSIYYGKTVASRVDADALVRRYFTRGVARPGTAYHYDVAHHQGNHEESMTSGFSNGSETFENGRNFAMSSTGAGVVFICDVARQEVLNVRAFQQATGRSNLFDSEREVLVKGGRDPRTIRAAIIYEGVRPVAFYTNPNFVEPEARR